MSFPQQEFEEILDAICRLTAQSDDDSWHDEAWSKIRELAKMVKNDQTLLLGCLIHKIHAVLDFLSKWHAKRPSLRRRVMETLGILLEDAGWMAVAQEESLQEKMLRIFDGDEVMCRKLTTEPATPKGTSETLEDVLPTSAEDIRSEFEVSLDNAVQVMQNFGWTFPISSIDANADKATKAFDEVYRAVNRLQGLIQKVNMSRSIAEQYIQGVTQQFDQKWSDVLRFLVSLLEKRGVLAKRITFVVDTLSEYVPSFREAAAQSGISEAFSSVMSRPLIDPASCAVAMYRQVLDAY